MDNFVPTGRGWLGQHKAQTERQHKEHGKLVFFQGVLLLNHQAKVMAPIFLAGSPLG
jgi:hypothetical protein